METEASPGSGRVTRYIIHRLQPVVPRQGAVGDGRGVYDEVVRPADSAQNSALRADVAFSVRCQSNDTHFDF